MNKVSIITVCYNSANTMRDTIESVLAQDYPHIEYIIVDGGSQDSTIEIVKEYRKQIAAIISEPDNGAYEAMNKGIKEATGDVVGVLNSDDFYVDNIVVRRLIERMESAGTDCVFADVVYVAPENTGKVVRYYDSSRFHPGRLRYGWMPAHPSLMVKREFFTSYGGYVLDYKIAADFEMIVRLFHVAGATYAYLPRPVIKMRMGGVSTNGMQARWKLNNEIVKACRANGIQTNLPLVLLKTPLKLLELVRRPDREHR
ncbi:MAG: glycosyltransferase [Desulfobacteraceae bacterium]|nr:glycosyltransferase [Desulfobacteraceae bacterium]